MPNIYKKISSAKKTAQDWKILYWGNESRKHPLNILICFFLTISIFLNAGCATIASQEASAKGTERSTFHTNAPVPHIYSGAIFDLYRILLLDWPSGEEGLAYMSVFFIVMPAQIIDLPLSFAADTVILPYTIKRQIKYGNIIKSKYYYEKPEKWSITFAAQEGNIERVKVLLNKKINVNKTTKEGETALLLASKKGHANIVKMLLDAGADPDICDKFHNTPLVYTIKERGDYSNAVVKVLLDAGADVNLKGRYYTALSAACYHGNTKVIEMLLDAGADVNLKAGYGRYGNKTPLSEACRHGDIDIVQMLIDEGADPGPKNVFSSQPLIISTQKNNIKMVKMLLDAGADINNIFDAGTALCYAEKYDMMELLIAAGGDPNKTLGKNRLTPLFVATSNKNERIIDLLLQNGADINLPGPDGETALFIAITKMNGTKLKLKQLRLVRKFLDAGADVNLKTEREGFSPLMFAHDPKLMKMLLDAGADPNIRDVCGKTALMHLAHGNLDYQEIRMLLAGADVNAESKHGQTALIIAIKYKRYKMIEMLLEKGADVNKVTRLGTALSVARESRDKKIIQMITAAKKKLGTDSK